MTPENWSKYTIQYQEAVDLLNGNMIETNKQDLFFPTLFLYRHYIELILKEIIINNREFLEIAEPFPKGHDINTLWKICRRHLEETDRRVDPGFAQSREYIEKIAGAYNALEADLNKFAEIDPDSEYFRYPVDAHGNPKMVDRRLLIDILHEFPELVKRISDNLDGISTGISTILDNKYEGLSQQDYYQ